MAEWHFPLTGGGAEYGINESGIQTFKSGMDKSLAREAIQNSLDAKVDDPDKQAMPVLVRFVKFDIDKDDLPGAQRLEDVLVKAREYYGSDKDAVRFYDEALKVIQGPIPCLKISDYNTKGLRGTAEQKEKSTFYALTKAMGVSNKSKSSGGSFGIGKSAPFSMSSLRTVIYSTYNIDDEFKLLGAARLTTFEDSPNEKRQNVGFFGNFDEEKQSVEELTDFDAMPEKFRRDNRSGAGTDISIVGYKAEDNWRASVLNAVLNDFYPAIFFNNLVVELIDASGTVTVNSDTLGVLMAEFAADHGDSYPYYQALSEAEYHFQEKLDILGDCSLYIKKGDAFPGKVQLARSPLMIVKPKRYGAPESYAALFICNDIEKGDPLLRNLEPAAHNDWIASLWDPLTMEPKVKSYGSTILSELDTWIKGKIDAISTADTEHVLEIEGLGEYLPDEEVGDFEAEEDNDDLLDNHTEIRKKNEKKPVVSKPQVSIVKPVKTGVKTSKAVRQGDGTGTKPPGGSEEDEQSNINRIMTSLINSKSREINNGNGREYILSILPIEDTAGDLRIVARGEISHYGIELQYAKNRQGQELDVDGSMIKGLKLSKGVPELITMKLTDKGRYSVEVENYA